MALRAQTAARLCEAGKGKRTCATQGAAALGVAGQCHATGPYIERAIRLRQGPGRTQAVNVHRRCSVCRRNCSSRCKTHHHANRNHHIGDVRQVWHRTACPIGRIEPIPRSATNPGHRIQARDVGRGTARRCERVVAGICTRQADTCDAHGLTGTNIFIDKGSASVDRQRVPADAVIAGGDAGRGAAVVHLIHARVG